MEHKIILSPFISELSDQAKKTADKVSHETGIGVQFSGLAFLTQELAAARFCLTNGLVLLALPDHDAPVFAYQTWFKVGSRHEAKGKTGIAHLFEHLMFKGTKSHPAGEFDREMEKRGAQTNAATWVDWTYYRQSLPSQGDNFEVVAMYESDRMTQLLLTQQLVDAEREVVKNERRQRVDNSIHGTLDEILCQTSFTVHPYGHPTIGYMEDLNGMTMTEFEQFYRTYYAPNNAIVVIVGDLALERIVKQVAQSYGYLPKQFVPEEQVIREPVQKEIRTVQLRKPTDSERVSMTFHAPAQTDADYTRLQIAAEILCGGETGSLYQELVIDKEICQEVHASLAPYQQPGLFQFDLLMKPEQSSQLARDIVLAHLFLLKEKGPDEEQVEKAKNRIELAFIRALLDVDGKAEQLGHFETTTQDASFVAQWFDNLQKVTVADVQQAVKNRLDTQAYTLVSVLPEE